MDKNRSVQTKETGTLSALPHRPNAEKVSGSCELTPREGIYVSNGLGWSTDMRTMYAFIRAPHAHMESDCVAEVLHRHGPAADMGLLVRRGDRSDGGPAHLHCGPAGKRPPGRHDCRRGRQDLADPVRRRLHRSSCASLHIHGPSLSDEGQLYGWARDAMGPGDGPAVVHGAAARCRAADHVALLRGRGAAPSAPDWHGIRDSHARNRTCRTCTSPLPPRGSAKPSGAICRSLAVSSSYVGTSSTALRASDDGPTLADWVCAAGRRFHSPDDSTRLSPIHSISCTRVLYLAVAHTHTHTPSLSLSFCLVSLSRPEPLDGVVATHICLDRAIVSPHDVGSAGAQEVQRVTSPRGRFRGRSTSRRGSRWATAQRAG